MCRVCNGNVPAEKEYYHLRDQSKALLDKWSRRGDAETNPAFVSEVVALDNIRLSTGAGWGNPRYLGKPIQLMFSNSDADRGLLLYVICIWTSYQKKAETVWSRHLVEADDWISGRRSAPPRQKMPNLASHLNKTRNVAINSGSIGNWFADAIAEIAGSNGRRPGNIYRMAGRVFRDLLDASRQRKRNIQGQNQLLGGQPGLLDWKRLWLLLRSLRRDNCLVRCLFERALRNVTNGEAALEYWYDDGYFDAKECQLPVDVWVRENWIKLMNGSAFSSREELKEFAKRVRPRVVAEQARRVAQQHDISPSAVDVLFLAGE